MLCELSRVTGDLRRNPFVPSAELHSVHSKLAKQVIKLSATVSARVVTADPSITTLDTIESQLKDMLKLCQIAPEIYDML